MIDLRNTGHLKILTIILSRLLLMGMMITRGTRVMAMNMMITRVTRAMDIDMMITSKHSCLYHLFT